jgi:hypothetical protein
VRVAAVKDIPVDGGATIRYGYAQIAVFNANGNAHNSLEQQGLMIRNDQNIAVASVVLRNGTGYVQLSDSNASPMMEAGVTAMPTAIGRVHWIFASDQHSSKIGESARSLGALGRHQSPAGMRIQGRVDTRSRRRDGFGHLPLHAIRGFGSGTRFRTAEARFDENRSAARRLPEPLSAILVTVMVAA